LAQSRSETREKKSPIRSDRARERAPAAASDAATLKRTSPLDAR
jgi:hypothetical protein